MGVSEGEKQGIPIYDSFSFSWKAFHGQESLCIAAFLA